MDTVRSLPKPLERLGPLATDVRLTGSKTLANLWRRLDQEAWDRTNNPYIVLQHAHTWAGGVVVPLEVAHVAWGSPAPAILDGRGLDATESAPAEVAEAMA
jgi:hypothetical protein